jgi:hypothetical protein
MEAISLMLIFALGYGLLRGSFHFKLLCILVVVIGIVALIFQGLPPPSALEKARAVRCGSNLRQIALAASAYRDANTNAAPQSLLDLIDQIPDPAVYICKGTGHKTAALENVMEWTDYVFVSSPGTNNVLAFCPPKNHKGKMGVVVLKDGTFRVFPTAESFNEIIGQ